MNKIIYFILALFITTTVFILEVKKEYREKQIKEVPTTAKVSSSTTTTTTKKTTTTTTTTKKKTDADKYKGKGKYYNSDPKIKKNRGK